MGVVWFVRFFLIFKNELLTFFLGAEVMIFCPTFGDFFSLDFKDLFFFSKSVGHQLVAKLVLGKKARLVLSFVGVLWIWFPKFPQGSLGNCRVPSCPSPLSSCHPGRGISQTIGWELKQKRQVFPKIRPY